MVPTGYYCSDRLRIYQVRIELMHILWNVEKTWLWSKVYVYDILKAGNNRAVINEVKGYIEYHFKIKDMSPVKTMLSINIYHNVLDGLLTMDQFKMIK